MNKMTFKIKDVRVYRDKRLKENQITPEVIIRGPNNTVFYRSEKTVQALDKKIYKEFGLELKEEHINKIINDAGFHAVFGGISKGKKYKNQKNIL
jgi:hypothetical protein